MSNIRIAGAQNIDFLAYRTHKLMKNLFFTAVLMSAGFLFTSQAEAREGGAMVRTVSGEATMSIDGKNWSPLKVGTVLRTGATVKTSKDAQADLFLGLNGSMLRLAGNSELTFNSSTANKVVDLSKSEPFRWRVTAQGETGSTPAQSQLWKFYLAGDAQINYAPFPPDLVSPKSGANVFAVNNEVALTWSTSDVDNDLSSYKVYFDNVDGSTLLGTYDHSTETTTTAVSVSSNTLYYWKVIAIDSNGNESDSGVYTFRVQ